MRRLIASLLLGLISVMLMAPALSASAASGTPACCRRDGKHHCGTGGGPSSAPSGPALQAHCPYQSHAPGLPTANERFAPLTQRVVDLPDFQQSCLTAVHCFFPDLRPFAVLAERGPPFFLA
ncbi:MAG TPA: DUF2946 family protein [Bryobacteraceae bacterium]|nr:DUF2946 family protein [Bryobacteraceae bacterium]